MDNPIITRADEILNSVFDTDHLKTSDSTSLGIPITGESIEAGGSGLIGWLSSLRKRLPTALGVSGGLKTEDNGTAWTSVFGVAGVPVAPSGTTVTAITDAPTSGQKIVLDDLVISTDTAQSISIKEETAGTLFMPVFYMPANSTIQITLRDTKHQVANANRKLTATCSASSHNTSILAGYHSEA